MITERQSPPRLRKDTRNSSICRQPKVRQQVHTRIYTLKSSILNFRKPLKIVQVIKEKKLFLGSLVSKLYLFFTFGPLINFFYVFHSPIIHIFLMLISKIKQLFTFSFRTIVLFVFCFCFCFINIRSHSIVVFHVQSPLIVLFL